MITSCHPEQCEGSEYTHYRFSDSSLSFRMTRHFFYKTDTTYDIEFRDFTLTSKLYDIDIVGYNNQTNKLHLFDIETIDESIVNDGIDFNKNDIEKNLTLFL